MGRKEWQNDRFKYADNIGLNINNYILAVQFQTIKNHP